MDNITDIFVHILEQSPRMDIAQAEFARLLVDDIELRRAYRSYCRENGVSERDGFSEFCEEYYAEKGGIWDVLEDFDNQE